MSQNPQDLDLRKKKLGSLIAEARIQARKTEAECAAATGVSAETYQAYEQGEKAPSLPQLELLAYIFNLPPELFEEKESAVERPTPRSIVDAEHLLPLRHRLVATTLRKLRMAANLSVEEIERESGLQESRLQAYESGEEAIPMPELELLASALGGQIDLFYDKRGPIGKWRLQQQAIQKFLQLPGELQEFVVKPVNKPYIELAARLSELSSEKLRSIAEGLLEITY